MQGDAWPITDTTGATLENEVEDDDLFDDLLAGHMPLKVVLSGMKSRPPNACTQCSLEKKSRESGHTKLGWCPEVQSYTLRASKDKDKDKDTSTECFKDEANCDDGSGGAETIGGGDSGGINKEDDDKDKNDPWPDDVKPNKPDTPVKDDTPNDAETINNFDPFGLDKLKDVH